jgi:cytochrome c oxidase cbb3-type subunit 3
MTRRSSWLLMAAIGLVAIAGCSSQPESLAAAAAPALGGNKAVAAGGTNAPTLATMPIGPLPGQPETDLIEPVNPFGTDPVAVAEGRRLFTSYNCSGCHGDHAGGGMGPSLRDERWIYGGTDARIANSIATGRAHGMPAWGSKVTAEQTWKLAAYIKSLRTAREPEPPAGN